MITMKGKYNSANIMIDSIDESTKEQIQTFLNHPAFSNTYIAIMPDCHAGKGAVVGFTMKINDYIIPNIVGVDIGCFEGSTKIPLLNGTEKTLKELSKSNKSFYVYSMDDKLQIQPGKAKALKTRENANVIKVVISGGHEIVCTPDHLFMLIDGTYKKANELKPMDSLMPLYRTYTTRDGYENVYSLFSRAKSTHKIVDNYFNGKLPKGYIIHHKDNTWYNNDPSNLIRLTTKKHSSLHREQNPIFGTKEFLAKRKITLEKNGYYNPKLLPIKQEIGRKNITNYMKNNPEKFKEDIKDNGKRGAKYLIAFNKRQDLFTCEDCGRKVKGKGAFARHKTIHSNHKVLYIENTNKKIDVYCLQVEKFHNFALSDGIFVHNCGMLTRKFTIENIDLPKFDTFIKENIPSGFSINNNLNILPTELVYDVKETCNKIGIEDSKKALRAIGSLGGGNHFIEIGKDSKDYYYVTIHSGSRNFGLKVANYYQFIAKKKLEKYFIKDQYKDLEFLLLDEQEGKDYIYDLKIAQKFASINRLEMMNRITEYLGFEALQEIESIHNFIGDDNIIRKGATPANLNQLVIIPFNMRDGLAICRGLGNSKYNYSAPHGAGRILSRTQAKKVLSVDTFKEQMSNIYTSTATIETIDEAPNAYKDKQIIIDNIKETVEILDFVKPVYNFKAGAD